MNMNSTDNLTAWMGNAFVSACEKSCQRILAKVQEVRKALGAEYRQGLRNHDRMLELAFNEAEGLARETGFPLLFFPTLAMEKADAVTSWDRRQRALRVASLALAAA